MPSASATRIASASISVARSTSPAAAARQQQLRVGHLRPRVPGPRAHRRRASPAPRRSGARRSSQLAAARPRGCPAAGTRSRCRSRCGRRRRCGPRRARAAGRARRARTASPSAPQTSAISVIAISQFASRGKAANPPLGDLLELGAGLVRAAQLDQQQRRGAAPGRDRRVELDEAAHRALDLGQPALLAADVEHRLRVVVQGVLGLPALADRQRLLGQPLGLVELAGELRAGAAEQRRPPEPDRPVQRFGELGDGGDLDVDAVDVAELHQVDDRPAGALQLELGVAGLLGHAAAARRRPRAAARRSPAARARSGGRRGRSRACAGRRSGGRSSTASSRQRQPQLRLAGVVELERHPRQQPRAQRRVVLRAAPPAPRRAAPTRPGSERLERRPRPGHAQRGARQQHRVPELARGADRGLERLARLVLEPRAVLATHRARAAARRGTWSSTAPASSRALSAAR